MIRLAAAVVALVCAACSPMTPEPAVATDGRIPAAATGTLGSIFDAPPGYPGYVWTRNGQAVKPEELGTIAASGHCGWESATLLHIGWPVGTLSTSSAEARQYIRDPRGVMRARLRGSLDLHATLPSDARPTGYMYGSIQIFVSPTDQDDAIYVVGPLATERWPRSDPFTLCA